MLKQTDIKKLEPKLKAYLVRDELVKGLALKIYPSGRKSWLLDYNRPDGRRNTIKLGDASVILSPVQAREIAKEKLIEVSRGIDPNDIKKNLTLQEVIENHYIKYIKESQRNYQYTLGIFLNDFKWLLNKKLSSINSLEIEDWQMRENAKNKSATVNRKMTVLKSFFSWAVRHQLVDSNPTAPLQSLAEDDSDVSWRYLSSDERTRLLVALNSTTRQMYTIVILALNTGIRKNALLSLKWEDINFKERNIRLNAASAKSRKFETIPMNETVYKLLYEWQRLSPKSIFLFVSSKTGKKLVDISNPWRKILRDAKIDNFRFHDLRHDFASRLVMKGVDLNTVRELMTHSDIKMTLRYAHLAPEKTKSAVDLLD